MKWFLQSCDCFTVDDLTLTTVNRTKRMIDFMTPLEGLSELAVMIQDSRISDDGGGGAEVVTYQVGWLQ